MEARRVPAAELKAGDVVETWFGNHPILRIRPYNGPFDFVIGIAVFPNTEMSIEGNQVYDVLN